MDNDVEPEVPPIKVKLVESERNYHFHQLKHHSNQDLSDGTFPMLVTAIVYMISSPRSLVPLPLLSFTIADFSIFINGNGSISTVVDDVDISIIVGSSTCFHHHRHHHLRCQRHYSSVQDYLLLLQPY